MAHRAEPARWPHPSERARLGTISTPGLVIPELRGPGPSAGSYDDSVYQRLLRERIVFLGSQVEDSVANLLCAQILLLAAEAPTDIFLYINLARWFHYGGYGDLRHHAVRPERRRHRGHGTRRVDGAVPAQRRSQGQALRPCRTRGS